MALNHSTWAEGSVVIARQPPPEPAPVVDLQALQAASGVLEDKMNQDSAAVPDFGEMLTIRAYICPCTLCIVLMAWQQLAVQIRECTAFSTTTTAYPSRSDGSWEYQTRSSNTTRVRGRKILKYCFHPISIVHVATQQSTNMGLLPEIERVWITVDHQLILWDYVEGFAVFVRYVCVALTHSSVRN